MITFFSIPKADKNNTNLIQKNAIHSWLKLTDDIILFGKKEEIKSYQLSRNIKIISGIKRNRLRTPILSDVFKKIYHQAKYPILAYINTDVILFTDFIKSIKQINFSKFLLISKRRNILLNKPVSFDGNYKQFLIRMLYRQKRENPIGNSSEFFVFPKTVKFQIPDFAIGRLYWDSWIIYRAKLLRIPVIDGTKTIYCLHQIHDYSHHKDGKDGVWFGPEAEKNYRLSGGAKARFKVTDADWITTPNGLNKQKNTVRRFIRAIRVKGVINSKLNIYYYPLYLVLNIFFKSIMLMRVILFKRGILSIIDTVKHPEQIEYKFKEL